jgi:hypothetical protein
MRIELLLLLLLLLSKVKIKSEFHPITGHEGPEGRRDIAQLFLEPRH